jgi:hypothetical protein
MDHRSVTALPQLNRQTTDVPLADLQPPGSFALRELLTLV